MASVRNILTLTGTTDGQNITLNYPYDMFIIGDGSAGSPVTTLQLPFTGDLQDGYTFYIVDYDGKINLNGPYLVPNDTDNVSGNTIYVNTVNVATPTGVGSPLYQPFTIPNAIYKVTYEFGDIGSNNLRYFTLSAVNNGVQNTNQYINEVYFTGTTPTNISGNSVTVDGAPSGVTDNNSYSILDLGGVMNYFTALNTILVDCNLVNDPNAPDHYVIQLPDDRTVQVGTTLRFIIRNATLSTDNSKFLMIGSIDRSSNGRQTARIISPSIKTYFNGNYFVQLTTGESLELAWCGLEWFVTNISKQEYTQFNAKSFIHLNSKNPTWFDHTYIEQNSDNLTFDLDDVA